MLRDTEKHKCVRAVKSKPKALRHFKVDPLLKMDETVSKQSESIPFKTNLFHLFLLYQRN